MKSGSRALVFLLAGLVSLGLLWAGKKKEPKAAAAYSVVAGTVFRDTGFALPGAEVNLWPADAEGKKIKKLTFTTNTRGEFAFRVPAVRASYNLSAAAKGYQSQKKTVEVQPEERVDATFSLAAESK